MSCTNSTTADTQFDSGLTPCIPKTSWLKLYAAGVALAIALFALALSPAGGDQPAAKNEKKDKATKPILKKAVLRAGNYKVEKRIKPSTAALKVMAKETAPTATFQVTYHDFSDEAKKAFQGAVDVWGSILTTPVPIRVDAFWKPLDPGVLGSAGPSDIKSNFPGAPKMDTWYALALANKLAGADQAIGQSHIEANFSSVFPNWYSGTDGLTPGDKYDLMSVVLHELGHGLGFIGTMEVQNGQGKWGWGSPFPLIYDRFTENANQKQLLNTSLFPNPSTTLAGQLTSNHIFFNGPKAVAANGGSPVRLYAPHSWEDGSSYSHLDETTFPAGNPNSLMTPQLGMGEAIHDPGDIGRGILRDLGW